MRKLFSVKEIIGMDIMQMNYFFEKIIDENKANRIINQLEIAEAFQFAYIGSQPGRKGSEAENINKYKSWRNNKFAEIGINVKTENKKVTPLLTKKSFKIGGK